MNSFTGVSFNRARLRELMEGLGGRADRRSLLACFPMIDYVGFDIMLEFFEDPAADELVLFSFTGARERRTFTAASVRECLAGRGGAATIEQILYYHGGERGRMWRLPGDDDRDDRDGRTVDLTDDTVVGSAVNSAAAATQDQQTRARLNTILHDVAVPLTAPNIQPRVVRWILKGITVPEYISNREAGRPSRIPSNAGTFFSSTARAAPRVTRSSSSRSSSSRSSSRSTATTQPARSAVRASSALVNNVKRSRLVDELGLEGGTKYNSHNASNNAAVARGVEANLAALMAAAGPDPLEVVRYTLSAADRRTLDQYLARKELVAGHGTLSFGKVFDLCVRTIAAELLPDFARALHEDLTWMRKDHSCIAGAVSRVVQCAAPFSRAAVKKFATLDEIHAAIKDVVATFNSDECAVNSSSSTSSTLEMRVRNRLTELGVDADRIDGYVANLEYL